jgi:small subunit ribosomal protein S6
MALGFRFQGNHKRIAKERICMRPYELVVLLHPDLEIDVDAPIAKIEKIIEANGGKVTKRDNWGKKRLAYQIKKLDFAVYIYFEISMPTDKVRDLENTLLITDEVMRHLLVSKSDEAPAAKPAKTETKETKEEAKPKAEAEVK